MHHNNNNTPVAQMSPSLGRALSMIARRPAEPGNIKPDAAMTDTTTPADPCKAKCSQSSLVAL